MCTCIRTYISGYEVCSICTYLCMYIRICASVHVSSCVKAVACLLTSPSAEREGENANSQAPKCAGCSGVPGAAPCEVGGHHQRPHR